MAEENWDDGYTTDKAISTEGVAIVLLFTMNFPFSLTLF